MKIQMFLASQLKVGARFSFSSVIRKEQFIEEVTAVVSAAAGHLCKSILIPQVPLVSGSGKHGRVNGEVIGIISHATRYCPRCCSAWEEEQPEVFLGFCLQ